MPPHSRSSGARGTKCNVASRGHDSHLSNTEKLPELVNKVPMEAKLLDRVAISLSSPFSARIKFRSASNVSDFKWTLSKENLRLLSRQPAMKPCKRSENITYATLGFRSSSPSHERSITRTLNCASSILVYHDVLKGQVAQAFLQILSSLQKSDGPRALQALGLFFQLLSKEKASSWEDYLVERILLGEDNVFADSASKQNESEVLLSPLRAAAISDLNNLQKLNVSGETLAKWIFGINSNHVSAELRRAIVLLVGTPKIEPKFEVEEETMGRRRAFGFNEELENSHNENTNEEIRTEPHAVEDLPEDLPFSRIPSEPHRAKWRSHIASHEKCSDAVPSLEKFYHQNGTGAAAVSTNLEWTGKAFLAAPYNDPIAFCHLSIHQQHRDSLDRCLDSLADGKWAPHILISGLAGMGKSTLLRSALFDSAKSKGIRVVTITRSQVPAVSELLDHIQKAWQHKFVVFIDDLAYKSGDDSGLLTLKWKLESSRQPWPANAILAVTSPSMSFTRGERNGWTDSVGAELSQHFGLKVDFGEELSEDGFLEVSQELRNFLGIEGAMADESLKGEAEIWVRSGNERSILSAFKFLRSYL